MDRAMKIVRIKFKGSVHFGSDEGGIGRENVQNIVHSDTIFSMIVNAYAYMFGYNKAKVTSFIHSINALSSGFLFERDISGDYKYYLPRPLFDPINFFDEKFGPDRKLKYGKDLKKCSFIDLETFYKWINGESIYLGKISKPAYKDLYAIIVRPQHARDRLTNATSIYHVGEIFFKHYSGIYFLVDGLSNTDLQSVLDIASINGLGGRRSAGCGSFTYEIDDTTEMWNKIFKNENCNSFLCISLYYPLEEEKEHIKPLSYSIIRRKGWTFSSAVIGQFKRKTCIMFGEGSVFQNKPQGYLVDVSPEIFSEHPIFRFGKTLSVPCFAQEVINE